MTEVAEVHVCDECHMKTRKRIDAVCEKNTDKSVEWWENWWGGEIDRQIKAARYCEENHERTDRTASHTNN